MAILIKKVGLTHGVPVQGTPEVPGTFVGTDGDAVGAVGEVGVGFIVDEVADDNEDAMATAYGEGSIIEDTTASFTPMAALYSDGDGTISAVAGPVQVGQALTATEFLVTIGVTA